MAPLDQQIAGAVCHLTLQRPQARNALDAGLIAALDQALVQLPAAVQVVVLQGAGPVFCAGADLHDMRASKQQSAAANQAAAAALAQLFYRLDALPQVVIGRVQGAALGGGAGLLACCDMVVAASDCSFAFPEVRLGLVPAVIAPFVLQKMGASATRQAFVSGARFDAATALRWGLVHAVAEATQLDAQVQAWCAQVAANGPQAMATVKRMLATLPGRSAAQQRQDSIALIAAVRLGEEAQAGLQAFVAKQPPPWQAARP